jgi:hypothetical protein
MIRVVEREKRVAITRLFPHNKVDGLTWRAAGVYTSGAGAGRMGIAARAGRRNEEGRCLRKS